MATKSKYIDDIELRLTRGKPSDDFELERDQIGHWLDVVRDSMTAMQLNQYVQNGQSIPAVYIETQDCAATEIEDTPCDEEDCFVRYFFTMDYSPMTIINDEGVIKLVTTTGVTVNRAPLEHIGILRNLRYATPDTDRLVFYRQKDKIFVEGLTKRSRKFTKFTVFYVRSYTTDPVGNDDEFVIHEELVGPMLDQVEEIAQREVYGPYEDLENDGAQGIEPR